MVKEGETKMADADKEPRWYVVHTYSGYENKVKLDIEKTIENRQLQDRIFEVVVPMQTVEEVKNGVRKQVQRKKFPAYVFVNMKMDDDIWYVVRNTRGVTGFVGPGSKPVPLSEDDLKYMLGGDEPLAAASGFEIGETVNIISGVWQDTEGKITDINEESQTVIVSVDMFGRDTPVEMSFTDIQKIN